MKPRLLLHGYDTIECAYQMGRVGDAALDFAVLGSKKEALRACKSRTAAPVALGSEEFLLAPHGTGSGYPFLIENDVLSIQCGPNNTPNFFVTYRSYGLWQFGIAALHERFLAWANSVGYLPTGGESVDLH